MGSPGFEAVHMKSGEHNVGRGISFVVMGDWKAGRKRKDTETGGENAGCKEDQVEIHLLRARSPSLYLLSELQSPPFHFLTHKGVKASSVSLVRSIPMRSADMSPSFVREFCREARMQCPAPIAELKGMRQFCHWSVEQGEEI